MELNFSKRSLIWDANSLSVCGITEHPAVYGISFDSRTVLPGDMFFALSGKNDGHDFVQEALSKGACCAIVERKICENNIVVDSVMETLVKIASFRRAMFSGVVIGITGSVGKTTAKQMVASALQRAGKKVFATPKSYNNLLGLSYSLAVLPLDAEFAVLELGISEPGDMEQIAKLCQLDYSLITEIGPAHISNFESFKGVALEKACIIKHTKLCVIFNGQKWYSDIFKSIAKRYEVNYDCFELKDTMIEQSKVAWSALLSKIGINNAHWGELELNSVAGRRNVFHIGDEVDVIDAAYNANLTSMIESLKFLEENFKKNKIAILGDMIFLNERARRYHEFLSCYLESVNLLCVGESMKFLHNKRIANGGSSIWFESVGLLLEHLKEMPLKDVAILIKGSSDAHKSAYDLAPVVEYFHKLGKYNE